MAGAWTGDEAVKSAGWCTRLIPRLGVSVMLEFGLGNLLAVGVDGLVAGEDVESEVAAAQGVAPRQPRRGRP